LRLVARQLPELEAQAARLMAVLVDRLGPAFTIERVACKSQIGSGALPLETIPSIGLALRSRDLSSHGLATLTDALRHLPVPVIGRIADGALMLDLRCLEDEAGFLASLESLKLPAGNLSDGMA